MEMFKGTEVRNRTKLKLRIGPGDEAPRPAKKQRIFLTTAEEMVKLCGAFVQATSSACDKPLTPVKTMESDRQV